MGVSVRKPARWNHSSWSTSLVSGFCREWEQCAGALGGVWVLWNNGDKGCRNPASPVLQLGGAVGHCPSLSLSFLICKMGAVGGMGKPEKSPNKAHRGISEVPPPLSTSSSSRCHQELTSCLHPTMAQNTPLASRREVPTYPAAPGAQTLHASTHLIQLPEVVAVSPTMGKPRLKAVPRGLLFPGPAAAP